MQKSASSSNHNSQLYTLNSTLSTLHSQLDIMYEQSFIHDLEHHDIKPTAPRDCEDDYDEEEEHTHFYCTRCHRTFCLKQIHVPAVQLPDGFRLETVNYVLKGLCPECSEK